MKGLARVGCIFACVTVSCFCFGQVKYSLKDLGTLGGAGSEAYGINANGQVVGVSDLPGDAVQHAFLYSGGTMTDLGTLPGKTLSAANGINDLGQIVGTSYSYSNGEEVGDRAFLYSAGVMSDLGTLGGLVSWGTGIDDSGRIVGQSYPRGSFADAFLYSDGVMSNLGTLGGEWGSDAYAINASGQVVGVAFTRDGSQHPFLYSGGSMSDLGTLGGSAGYAYGVNASGQVVGWANTGGIGAQHAFLYSEGAMVDLGALPGGTWSLAAGINASAQVVGWGDGGAFVYEDGKMYDLSNLLDSSGTNWAIENASAINDAGQIAGFAYDAATGAEHAVLLTPDAEVAGTVALLDFVGDATKVPVVIELRLPGTTTVVQRQTVFLKAGGEFSFLSSLTGTYDVAAKASHWLRQRLPNVTLSSTGKSGLSFSLVNGDVNGDNAINFLDLEQVSDAWHSTPSSSNWNPNADLNGTGTVDLADWLIVAKNWRKSGDP